jgi:riboflavin kinase/FMN adenylyltransferase
VVLRNRQGLNGEIQRHYLTSPEERAALLGEAGVDVIITYPFNREVAQQTAHDFMQTLHQHLRMKHVCVGHDFALGRGREGDLPTLARFGQEFGYTLQVTQPVEIDGQVISSSQIRFALANGNVEKASRWLGRPYTLAGQVVHGDSRGRTLGFPTANLLVWSERLLPRSGVYACMARVGDKHEAAAPDKAAGSTWPAVVNIGFRPTFESQPATPSIEAHLLGFDRDLYDQQMSLSFFNWLRDEQRFSSVQALVAQVHADIERARKLLSGLR